MTAKSAKSAKRCRCQGASWPAELAKELPLMRWLLLVRVRVEELSLATAPPRTKPEDRVRLSLLGGDRFGLSVKRHTGRWERTLSTGSPAELVQAICATMQHLVAEC